MTSAWRRRLSAGFLILFSLIGLTDSANADWRAFFGLNPAPTERPPQFVLLAFDGSLNNAFWDESLTFAKENQVPFTYFASGVYFLLDQNKALYTEPVHGVGKSNIGWGGTNPANLITRMGNLRRAFAEGHEIGSHANGHFDGSNYTYDQWKFEFSQFPKLIFDAFTNNQITPPKDFSLGFGMDEVKGFRAPLLGEGPPLYDVLAEEGFHYDTSKMAQMDYWPQKEKGIWNYPLAIVNIAGTAKKTISMDYNFYVSQSNAIDDPNVELRDVYGQEMLQTYYNYFLNNYNGSRAPVHIGHHFAKWNGGVYWTAMKAFAQKVCVLPEVRCVTYKGLTDFMETRTPDELGALSKGLFPKAAPLTIAPVLPHPQGIAITASIGDLNGDAVGVKISGRDAALISADQALLVDWKLDGAFLGQGLQIPTAGLKAKLKANSILSVALRFGKFEILRTTRKIVTNTFQQLVVDGVDLEARSLKGDLPEAHFHDEAPEMIDTPIFPGHSDDDRA